MKNKVLLLFVAILPVVLLGIYIYNKDKNKEPKHTVMKMFIGGLLSAVMTIIITILINHVFPWLDLDYNNYSSIGLLIYAFLMISMIEEFSKWIILYFLSYHDKEFDELYDMIIYSTFVSLGFAAIENIIYVFDYGFSVALLRIFSAVPSHVAMAVFMGYFLSMAKYEFVNKNHKAHNKNMILSIIIPVLLHGLYDYVLLLKNEYIIFLFVPFIMIVYIIAYNRLNKLSKSTVNLNNME